MLGAEGILQTMTTQTFPEVHNCTSLFYLKHIGDGLADSWCYISSRIANAAKLYKYWVFIFRLRCFFNRTLYVEPYCTKSLRRKLYTILVNAHLGFKCICNEGFTAHFLLSQLLLFSFESRTTLSKNTARSGSQTIRLENPTRNTGGRRQQHTRHIN